MRLGKYDELNGHAFKLKPKTVKASKIKRELIKEMEQWQKENNKEAFEYREKHKDEIQQAFKEDDIFNPVLQDMPEDNDWMEDEEFRAKRFSKMAHACMEFEEKPPAKLWASEDLEVGVIELAWDFFIGNRAMPKVDIFKS